MKLPDEYEEAGGTHAGTLLVIDMQNAWLNSATERYDKEGVIARINRAAQCTRQRGGQVIFVRHESEEAPAGSAEWQIDAELRVDPSDLLVDKAACDAFSGTDLLVKLNARGARLVYLCGLATEFCVDTTLRAALSHGFDVIALADAHTTGNRPHLTGSQIVVHHNWTWAKLAVPAQRQIQVLTVAQAFSA